MFPVYYSWKTNRWLVRVFCRILDSFIKNAYGILEMNDLSFGEKRNNKRLNFTKKVAKSLITSYAQRRF